MIHSELIKKIGYIFTDPALLEESLTHPSCSGVDAKRSGYDRLEFLGDSVLSLIITQFLFKNFPEDNEGQLTRRRAALINAKTLFAVGARLNLLEYLFIIKDKNQLAEREYTKIVGNALEALIGALYLDGGWAACENFIIKNWSDRLRQDIVLDSKTYLQEWTQQNKACCPKYYLMGRVGKDHAPVFEVKVCIPGLPEFTGSGGSKKAAEERAAKLAVEFINSSRE